MKYGVKPSRVPLSGEKEGNSCIKDIPYDAEREGERGTDK